MRRAVNWIVVVNTGLALAFLLQWWALAFQGELWRSDFGVYHAGWRAVLDGAGDRLYDLSSQALYQSRSLDGRNYNGGVLPFNYSPQTAVVLAPLGGLSRAWAFGVWCGLGLIGFLISLRTATQWLSAAASQTRRTLVMTALAFPPVFLMFLHGSFAILIVPAFVLVIEGIRRDKSAWVAWGLLCISVKPQAMVLIVVALVAGRRWEALRWSIGLGIATFLLTTMVLGPKCWLDWLQMVNYSNSEFGNPGFDAVRMYILRGWLFGWLGSGWRLWIDAVSWLALALSSAAVFLLWREPVKVVESRRSARELDARLALTVWIAVIVAPHASTPDAALLIWPVFLAERWLRDRGAGDGPYPLIVSLMPGLFLLDYAIGAHSPLRPFFLMMVLGVGWLGREYGIDRRDGEPGRSQPDLGLALPLK